MSKLKDLIIKFFGKNSNDFVEDIKETGHFIFVNKNETKVYYKDLERQKKQILTQIIILNKEIEQYRSIGAKDTMNWLQGYKEILRDQLKEIDNAEVRLGEDK